MFIAKKVLGIIVIIFFSLVAIFALFPQLTTVYPLSLLFAGHDFGIEYPFAQILALPGVLAVAVLIVGAVFLLLGLLRFIFSFRGWLFLISGLLLVSSGLLQVGLLWAKGWSSPAYLPENLAPGSVRVLTFNTEDGATGAGDIAGLILKNKIDIAVLIESKDALGGQVKAGLSRAGQEYAMFTNGASKWDSAYRGEVVLVSSRLGKYTGTSNEELHNPAVVISPQGKNPAEVAVRPSLFAGHVYRPAPSLMSYWKRDINHLVQLCNTYSNLLVAGDFNGSLANADLRNLGSCQDAAYVNGVAAVGTWPADYPSFFGAAIDHILANKNSWKPVASAVVKVGNSDHRALMSELVPVGR